MHVSATHIPTYAHFPVIVRVESTLAHRNRWTTFFRPLLALPHLILVGGPVSAALWWTWRAEPGNHDWSAGGGVLGAVVNGKQYYRDTRGYCYYVDQYGRPVYDYNTRC